MYWLLVNVQVFVRPPVGVCVPTPVNVTTHCPAKDGVHKRSRERKHRMPNVLVSAWRGKRQQREATTAGSDNSGKRQQREHKRISSVRGLHVASRTAGGGYVKNSIRHGRGFVKRFE